MQISKNKVVSFHYCLFNEAGEEVESTRKSEPSLCLVGAGNILSGLERAMSGKVVGDTFKADLQAYEAYGVRQDNQQRVPAKYLKHEGKLRPGQQVRIQLDSGVKLGTVIKVGKFNVDVDMNHPLAGQCVCFDVEIVDIREGTQEEITHGHAHGAGGHQH
ncbi:MAG: peptidylprolyl isomerase [Spongiibacteraceae bacterium]|nr:peptidylprolyl isomerase [Spongiibacteraceae bacterium]